MEEWKKRLLATTIMSLVFTGCGIALMFTLSVLYNSRQISEGMIQQQAIERKLQQQNEEFYDELYDRYDGSIKDLQKYQSQTNKRLAYLEEQVGRLLLNQEADNEEQ